MLSKADKALLKSQYKNQEKEGFESSLPVGRNEFQKLFRFLDIRLSEKGCDNTLRFCTEFFTVNRIANSEEIIYWLNDRGGYCDCEVLANVEEKFDD